MIVRSFSAYMVSNISSQSFIFPSPRGPTSPPPQLLQALPTHALKSKYDYLVTCRSRLHDRVEVLVAHLLFFIPLVMMLIVDSHVPSAEQREAKLHRPFIDASGKIRQYSEEDERRMSHVPKMSCSVFFDSRKGLTASSCLPTS